MATFKKKHLKTEKELHGIIKSELDALEEGLKLLQYEFGTVKGEPDFLCVDSGGRLTIIEVKLEEDDNILLQALGYYSTIDKDRYHIAQVFKDRHIKPDEHPRVILIARRFSDDIRRLCTLLKPDIGLYEYTVLTTDDKQTGIHYHPIALLITEDTIMMPVSIEEHIAYLTDDRLKGALSKLRESITSIGPNIEEYSTQSYLGYKYKGRLLCGITIGRKYFQFWSYKIDENGNNQNSVSVIIENESNDYTDVMRKAIEIHKFKEKN